MDIQQTDVDQERARAAEIVHACLVAGKPTLALGWIASGASLREVTGELLRLLTSEPSRSSEAILSEFDALPWVFCGMDVSRRDYARWREREEARFIGCGGRHFARNVPGRSWH